MVRIRCAVYTRKSSEDGLEQDFNSLHAQREACAAYVASQKGEGWTLLPEQYDDGGLSGGTLERAALRRLLEDFDAGRVDQLVVYKIDRLTRSLADFAKLVERLDRAGASFVSVTQSFNTATSMGRLTLNVLLSFAQFEREVTAERIRGKIGASKREGLWMGGLVPFGFQANGRTLAIREDEAAVVRSLFDLYDRLRSVRAVHEEVLRLGHRSRRRMSSSGRVVGGCAFSRGHIHQMLTIPIYAGRIRHKDLVHEGRHPAVVEPSQWDAVESRLADQAARERGTGNRCEASSFIGKLFDDMGDRLTPSHACKKGVRHRYYVSRRLVKYSGASDASGWRLPARPLEQAVAAAVADTLSETSFPSRLIMDASAAELISARERLLASAEALVCGGPGSARLAAELAVRVDLAPDRIMIVLDGAALATAVGLDVERILPDALSHVRPLRLRRRGVEARTIMGDAPGQVDRTLLRNIALARKWLAALRDGGSLEQIAAAEGVDKSRVKQLLPLAFLAPDIVASVVKGKQPAGLTTKWLMTHQPPACWGEQRRLLAAL